MDSVLLGYLFIESDKYDEEIGQDRVVELLVDEKFSIEQRTQRIGGAFFSYTWIRTK